MRTGAGVCLAIAEGLRADLLEHEHEHPLLLLANRSREEADELLKEFAFRERTAVEQLVSAPPTERALLLRELEPQKAELLLTAAIRYCLEAAAILQGYEDNLANRPVDKSIVTAAHRALEHVFQDHRSQTYPMNGYWF